MILEVDKDIHEQMIKREKLNLGGNVRYMTSIILRDASIVGDFITLPRTAQERKHAIYALVTIDRINASQRRSNV